MSSLRCLPARPFHVTNSEYFVVFCRETRWSKGTAPIVTGTEEAPSKYFLTDALTSRPTLITVVPLFAVGWAQCPGIRADRCGGSDCSLPPLYGDVIDTQPSVS